MLVGVDGGADALLEAGYRPDVIVGDMDSVSDAALAVAAPSSSSMRTRTGARPGASRLDRLGLPSMVVPTPGISEDLAMLLAYEKGAELIVAVGTHFNLVEFLERNRAGHVVDLPDPAEGGGDARRRAGRLAALPPARRARAARRLRLAGARRSHRGGLSRSPGAAGLRLGARRARSGRSLGLE